VGRAEFSYIEDGNGTFSRNCETELPTRRNNWETVISSTPSVNVLKCRFK